MRAAPLRIVDRRNGVMTGRISIDAEGEPAAQEILEAINDAVKEFWQRRDLRDILRNRIDSKLKLKIIQETVPPVTPGSPGPENGSVSDN